MARDRLTDTLGPAVGRRAMLQGLGLGLVGLALAPSAARAATGDTPTLAFTYKGDAGHVPSGIPVLATGAVVVVDTFTSATGSGSTVQSIPLSGESTPLSTPSEAWIYSIDSTEGFATPVVLGDAVVVAAGDGRVVSLAAVGGTENWVREYPVANTRGCPFATTGTDVFFVTSAGFLVRLDEDGDEVYDPVDLGLGDDTKGFSAPVVIGGSVVVLGAGSLTARDAATGDRLWTVPVPAHADSHPVLAAGVGAVYYSVKGTSSSTGEVVAVDLSDGSTLWSSEATDKHKTLSAPAFGSGTVFYGDSEGVLTAVDASTGAALWHQGLGGDLSESDVVVDDGVVYATGQNSSTTVVHALPVDGSEQAKHKTGFPGVALIGVQSGLCFYSKVHHSSRIKVEGVDLGEALSEFFTQSQLLADGYEGSYGAAQAHTPHFQTNLCLYTADKAPRADARLRIKVSEKATVVVDGHSHDLETSDHLWVRTDSGGELDIVVKPTGESLTCPKLKLWGPFMAQGEQMVVYPDQATMSGLSTVQGSTLAGATTFDGSHLLPDSYRDDADKAEKLATTVRTVMGTHTTPALALDVPYVAFPGETTNLAFQASDGPTDRDYVSSSDEDWTASFDDGLMELEPTVSASAPRGQLTAKGKGWDDFFDDVVKGTKKLTRITWKAGEKAVKEFEAGVDDAYAFVVDTVEKAAGVVAGILKTFGKDIDKIIETLTSILSWGHIKDVHQQIRTAVKEWLPAQAGNTASASLVTKVRQVATTITDDVDQVVAQAGGKGPGAYGGSTGQHQFYGSSFNQAKWIQGKVKHNLSKGSIKSSSGSLASAPDLGSTLDTILEQVLSQLDEDLATQAKAVFSTTSQKVGSPSQLATAAATDLLAALALAVDAIVDAVAVTAEAALATGPSGGTLLSDVVEAVLALLDATIDIPVISDLYKLATGDAMTFLDMACLVIAIPTAILVPETSEDELAAGSSDLGLEVATGVALGLFMLIDPLADLYAAVTGDEADPEVAKVVATGWAVVDVVVVALSFPALVGETGDELSYAMFLLQLAPLVLTLGGTYEKKPEDGSAKQFSDQLVNWACMGAGTLGLIFAVVQVIEWATDKGGLDAKDWEAFFGRVATFLPLTFKPMLLGGPGMKYGFVAAEAACDLVGFILWIVQDTSSSATGTAATGAQQPGTTASGTSADTTRTPPGRGRGRPALAVRSSQGR